MWEPQPLATLRASMACMGITLPKNINENKIEEYNMNLRKTVKRSSQASEFEQSEGISLKNTHHLGIFFSYSQYKCSQGKSIFCYKYFTH
jgi:hypothetical protein